MAVIASHPPWIGLSKKLHVTPSASVIWYSTHPGCGSLLTQRTATHFTVTRRESARSPMNDSPATLFECLLEHGKHELVLQTRRSTLELDQGRQAEHVDGVTEDLDPVRIRQQRLVIA